jgi:alkanesulfonate monooxygenase SsuD/methylene tetrahydromethanopterin reductase-like flavin-dependent oxidoreductase (luciferase family)
VSGSPERIAEALAAMHEAGADEVIVVADPITEASVDALADVLTRREA